ncbi:IS3 family transposase [Oceanispirochaeta crateris]|uniref:IS3 family transposase n=1 Tax=Oceanispirochaeta crateris TaxID=2518645 RepID=UPI003CCC7D50
MLDISRSSFYYKPTNSNEAWELDMIILIIEELGKTPFYGYRKIAVALNDKGYKITRKQVRRLMKRMGLSAIYPKRNLSKARKEHKKYPYLLKGKRILFPNQVWATDMTYLKINNNFVYLVAVLDLYSRKVLSWRISNTMDVSFCVDALEEALMQYGIPAIFNTDQGSQFTSDAFVGVLKGHGIQISMDGKGRALDNIYVERLWRTLKYEEIYLHSYDSIIELRTAVNRYFNFYNKERFHQSLDYETPDEIYYRTFMSAGMRAA